MTPKKWRKGDDNTIRIHKPYSDDIEGAAAGSALLLSSTVAACSFQSLLHSQRTHFCGGGSQVTS